MLVASIPFVMIEQKYRILSYTVEEHQADALRQLDIYSELLLS
jgi:hypothetical protein